jgi:hypothetical protein
MSMKHLMRAFSDPRYPYRWAPDASPIQASFGGYHGFKNLPHVSEDYIQILMAALSLISLGMEPRLAVSTAMYYKLREHSRETEMPAARPRWSGGGEPGQGGGDIIVQRSQALGPQSFFSRTMQRNRGRFYITAPFGMLNIIFTPILILSGYTSFAGILLLFWFIGGVANQVLTLNGWALEIKNKGFWGGSAAWLSTRFRDLILFGPLTFIELYGVLDANIKGEAYAFRFVLSGGAAMDDYTPNPVPSMTEKTGIYHLFRWMFFTGLIATMVNVYAIAHLDLLNAIMLYPNLVFTLGMMIGSYVYLHQQGPGPSFMNWKVRVPKYLGVALGILILSTISLGMGLFSRYGVGTSAILFVGVSLFFSLFPARLILVDPRSPNLQKQEWQKLLNTKKLITHQKKKLVALP